MWEALSPITYWLLSLFISKSLGSENKKVIEWVCFLLKLLNKQHFDSNKRKIRQIGFQQDLILLCFTCDHQESKNTIHRMYLKLIKKALNAIIKNFKNEQGIWIDDIYSRNLYKWPICIWKDAWCHQSSKKCKLKWDTIFRPWEWQKLKQESLKRFGRGLFIHYW